jgi:DNA modification methylase
MLTAQATPTPVELGVDAILDVTTSDQVVLDAFLGSGTTLIAAEKTGRRCRGIELDPRFVDLAVLRWVELTGEDAVLADTGESFAEVRERRRGEEACDEDAD